MEQLDYTNKEVWTPQNMGVIAQALGYVADERFAQAFLQYVDGVVRDARITNLLFPVAAYTFRHVQPPLERLGNENQEQRAV